MSEAGFSLTDIELLNDYDYRQVKELKKQIDKNRQINRIINQLEIFQAVYHAMLPFHAKSGFRIMKSWYNGNVAKLNKLFKNKQITVWDKMKRKSNRI